MLLRLVVLLLMGWFSSHHNRLNGGQMIGAMSQKHCAEPAALKEQIT